MRSSDLFAGSPLRDALNAQIQGVQGAVDRIPKERILQDDLSQVIDDLYDQFSVEKVVLEDPESVSRETQVDVSQEPGRDIRNPNQPFLISGVEIEVHVPYSGSELLLRHFPDDIGPHGRIPRGILSEIEGRSVVIMGFAVPADKLNRSEEYRSNLKKNISELRHFTSQTNELAEEYNTNLRVHVSHCIKQRRHHLGRMDTFVESLGIPIKKRVDAPDVQRVDVRRRRLVQKFERSTPHQRDAYISEDTYEHILEVIRYAGRSFEEAPRAFNVHPEEELRDIILAFLNMYFDVQASGETFRRVGKTDIRIVERERAAFVGECKNYGGVRVVHDAIDQLLGYTTWKDSKSSIILFNKDRKGFQAIQEKTEGILNNYHGITESLDTGRDHEWRIKAKHSTDPDRVMTVHVFLFDLYVPGKS